ncbi:MAG: 16S rRNA (guanine(966)-N(2))-methyltransferase RsmD [Pseudomonadales bacterium]|nr:16S rRNA (guanine(966)-N(2))-methyltransferase RsmD [Pseudomonadales bacterium]
MKRKGNTLRIIAGQWRSRLLTFPDIPGLRPTADRIRETLFNWLQTVVAGERCLDLFAGSGACGLEALSRHAGHVTFVEAAADAAAGIRNNLSLLDAGSAQVLQQDALAWLGSLEGRVKPDGEYQYGIIFIDPPFAANLHARVCQLLEQSGVMKDRAFIYLESGQPLEALDLPKNWRMCKNKRAGAVHYGLYQRT